MSVFFGALYHWSPKRNRVAILRDGLRIMTPTRDGLGEFPWVCFGTTPSSAWGLIIFPEDEEGTWDLWQTHLEREDRVRISEDFVPFVREVRILNSVAPARLWWVGERSAWPHDTIARG